MLARIAAACRAAARRRRGSPATSTCSRSSRRYHATARPRGMRIPAGYADLMPAFEAARRALAVRDEGTVPCNNDLLAANFIDDGDRIWLIDYEYSGNNDACFELGNIAGECGLADDALAALVTAYYGRPRAQQDRPGPAARPGGQVRLDPVGRHPARRQPDSTSTSGPGPWSGSRPRRPASPAATSTACSTTCRATETAGDGLGDGQDGRPTGWRRHCRAGPRS